MVLNQKVGYQTRRCDGPLYPYIFMTRKGPRAANSGIRQKADWYTIYTIFLGGLYCLVLVPLRHSPHYRTRKVSRFLLSLIGCLKISRLCEEVEDCLSLVTDAVIDLSQRLRRLRDCSGFLSLQLTFTAGKTHVVFQRISVHKAKIH